MKSEKMGLFMIVASLCVITAIFSLLFYYQRAESVHQIRIQGVSLARLLSNMSIKQLVPDQRYKGPLEIVRSLQTDANFAYAVVNDTQGQVLVDAVAEGIIVPPAKIENEPASWYAERHFTDPESERSFYEFYAPLIASGERVALIRVGYLEPELIVLDKKLSFLAMIALPVFLLTPLFYLLVKREIKPMKDASKQIKQMLKDQPIQTVELQATGEVGEFVKNFNHVVNAAENRIKLLEEQADGMLTTSKVLSYQKARIESTLQSLPDAVIILDEEGVVTFANRKMEYVTGKDSKQIVGTKPYEWCTNDKLTKLLTGLGNQVAHRVQSTSIELTPDNAFGKHLVVNAYPLFSPRTEDAVFGSLVIFHDASAETMASEARKEFVGRLSHELKTPLQIIGMYAETLRDPDIEDADIRIEAGNVISDEVEKMTGLIKNLLSITEIEMGSVVVERGRTRLNDLLEDILTSNSRASNQDISCRIQADTDLNAAFVDKGLLRIAINNLMTNAIKYNRPGGEVILSASENDNEFIISVKDTGIGINEEELQHVFERFYRSDDDAVQHKEGHGLGLALAQQIIQLHGGELRVQSMPGEGSEFIIVLKKTSNLLKEAI